MKRKDTIQGLKIQKTKKPKTEYVELILGTTK